MYPTDEEFLRRTDVKVELFKNLGHWTPDPYLRLFQFKNTGDRRCNVELHHAFVEKDPFFYVFTADDKRRFHFLHGFSPVPFVYSSVVGCDDENSFIIEPGFFYRVDNFPERVA